MMKVALFKLLFPKGHPQLAQFHSMYRVMINLLKT